MEERPHGVTIERRRGRYIRWGNRPAMLVTAFLITSCGANNPGRSLASPVEPTVTRLGLRLAPDWPETPSGHSESGRLIIRGSMRAPEPITEIRTTVTTGASGYELRLIPVLGGTVVGEETITQYEIALANLPPGSHRILVTVPFQESTLLENVAIARDVRQ